MKNFNRFELPLALRGFLDTSDNPDLALEETVQPTASLGDISDTPYLRYGDPCSGAVQPAAVAAQYGWAGFRPGSRVALQILSVVVTNQNLTAFLGSLRIATNAHVTASTTKAEASKLLAMAPADASALNMSSSIWRGAKNAFIGDQITMIQCPAASTLVITFPRPGIILRGNDPSGIPAFIVNDHVVNETFDVSVFAREWPLPGIRV